jgi:hypothetical protein
MAYLYHKVPDSMHGDILYPLNQLLSINKQAFMNANAKYEGREHVKEQRIPHLDCLWNDVLHFSAVDPREIKKAYSELGEVFKGNFYKIDPHKLNPAKTIIYLYQHTRAEDKLNEDNFAPFKADNLEQYTQLSNETVKDYKKRINQGERPFLYHRVPHILYKDSLDVSDVQIMYV